MLLDIAGAGQHFTELLKICFESLTVMKYFMRYEDREMMDTDTDAVAPGR